MMRASVKSAVLKCVTILNVFLLVSGSVAFGQNQSSSPGVQKNSEELGIQGYGRNDTSCLEWSDSCVSCRRNQPAEEFSCSNIGIACQPQNIKCLRRSAKSAKPKYFVVSLAFQPRSACHETFRRTLCGREMVAASPALNQRGVHVPAGPRMYMATCHAAVAVFPPAACLRSAAA